jgi:oligopeptidase B
LQELKMHGDARIDPWFWLRAADDPATLDYLKAENAYTEAMMKPAEGLQKALYDEMRARIKEDDSSVPEKEGDYYYYTRFEEGGQYPIYCRKYGTLDTEEEVLINVNQLAEDKDYLRVGVFKNSPDHQWLAYSLDTDGSEQYRIYVKNLATGELLDETIPNSYYSLEWANDSKAFFYDVLDQYHQPVKVLRHLLGNDPSLDTLVYQERDERFFVGLHKSSSKRFIYVVAGGNNMSEWHFLDADHPDGPLTLVEPRHEDFEYDVVDHGQRFLVRNNGDGARDFKVSETPIAAPGKENWKDFIPHEPGRPILQLYAFKEHVAVSFRTSGLPQVQVMELATGEAHTMGFGEEVYSVRAQPGREWDTPALRFTYASMTTPPTVYDYNMHTKERQFKKRIEVLGGFDSENYETRRLWAPARDGALVPSRSSTRRALCLTAQPPSISTGMVPTV